MGLGRQRRPILRPLLRQKIWVKAARFRSVKHSYVPRSPSVASRVLLGPASSFSLTGRVDDSTMATFQRSKSEVADKDGLSTLSKKTYEQQSKHFLNAFWDRAAGGIPEGGFSANQDKAEKIWEYFTGVFLSHLVHLLRACAGVKVHLIRIGTRMSSSSSTRKKRPPVTSSMSSRRTSF